MRNGRRNTNITARNPAQFFGASWAPNGRQLVAIRGQSTLVTMRPDGTGVRVLTRVSGSQTGIDDAIKTAVARASKTLRNLRFF